MQTFLNEITLKTYGWSEERNAQFLRYISFGYIPLRIIREDRGYYYGTDGKTRYLLSRSGAFNNFVDLGVQQTPVVGDWCAVDSYEQGKGLIEGVLSRTTSYHKPLVYEEGYGSKESDTVAANIDSAGIVIDSKYDFNLRRIERFVSLLSADYIKPYLILTKIDLIDNLQELQESIVQRFPDLVVFSIDSLGGDGIEPLLASLKERETFMLLGASGAGKSTLVNRLLGSSLIKTQEVRSADGKGRHTTTSRELHLLPNGALLLDTPGIRGVGMNSSAAEIAESFSDIVELSKSCRFDDCTHTGEPNCAVQHAVESGLLERDRYENYLQLIGEAVSYEQVIQDRKKKDKELGKILYQYRRESLRK